MAYQQQYYGQQVQQPVAEGYPPVVPSYHVPVTTVPAPVTVSVPTPAPSQVPSPVIQQVHSPPPVHSSPAPVIVHSQVNPVSSRFSESNSTTSSEDESKKNTCCTGTVICIVIAVTLLVAGGIVLTLYLTGVIGGQSRVQLFKNVNQACGNGNKNQENSKKSQGASFLQLQAFSGDTKSLRTAGTKECVLACNNALIAFLPSTIQPGSHNQSHWNSIRKEFTAENDKEKQKELLELARTSLRNILTFADIEHGWVKALVPFLNTMSDDYKRGAYEFLSTMASNPNHPKVLEFNIASELGLRQFHGLQGHNVPHGFADELKRRVASKFRDGGAFKDGNLKLEAHHAREGIKELIESLFPKYNDWMIDEIMLQFEVYESEAERIAASERDMAFYSAKYDPQRRVTLNTLRHARQSRRATADLYPYSSAYDAYWHHGNPVYAY